MRWSNLPFGGILELDADFTVGGVGLELEVVESEDGATLGMWFLAGTDTLLAVVEAGLA